MRYVLIEYVTGTHHPYMPNTKLYKYKDLRTGRLSLGAWVKKERVEEIIAEKNK